MKKKAQRVFVFLSCAHGQDGAVCARAILQERPDCCIIALCPPALAAHLSGLAHLVIPLLPGQNPGRALNLALKAAQQTAGRDADDAQVLLWNANLIPLPNALSHLCTFLNEHPETLAATPLELREEARHPETLRVLSIGLAVGCDGMLISLYEGYPAEDALCRKNRFFQLAACRVLALRLKDLGRVGGFSEHLDREFLGFDLTIRLARQMGRVGQGTVVSLAEARVIGHDRFAVLESIGLWNSQMERGRLPANMVVPDLHRLLASDQHSYRADFWLNEGAERQAAQAFHSAEEKWQIFRSQPSPKTLLDCLSSLPAEDGSRLRELIQSLPSTLPHVALWYKNKAERLLAFAQAMNLEELSSDVRSWCSNFSDFHDALRDGMRQLIQSGVYDNGLDLVASGYDAWQELVEPSRQEVVTELGGSLPEIAILMPVYNPDPEYFRQALASILSQSYPRWQLCLADDASKRPGTSELLRSLAATDQRIRLTFREQNGHISLATNSALALSDAPYVAFMDQDDLLSPKALELTALHLSSHQGHRYVYSDEDKIDGSGIRRSPVFKSTFDWEMQGCGHLSTCESKLVRELSGLRQGLEGAQDRDLELRISEKISADQIGHIPHILYHWRIHPGSTAGSIEAKPYALEAQKKALQDHARRRGQSGELIPSYKNRFHRFLITADPSISVSVVLLGDSRRIGGTLLRQLANFGSGLTEVIWQALNPKAALPRVLAAHLKAHLPEVELKESSPVENWQRGCREAANRASGEIIVFLSASLLPDENCRLEQLATLAIEPGISLVTGCIWDGDTALDLGFYPDTKGVFPLGQGFARGMLALMFLGQMQMNRRTLGFGCGQVLAAAKRERFLENGSFLEEMGEYAAIDYVLRAEKKGEICLTSPWVSCRAERVSAACADTARWAEPLLARHSVSLSAHPLRNTCLRATANKLWGLIL